MVYDVRFTCLVSVKIGCLVSVVCFVSIYRFHSRGVQGRIVAKQ
jgi:hypothetical protein